MPYNYIVRWYQSYSSPETDGALGLSGLLVLIGLWQVFKKAEYPGWAALVPVYNLYVLFKIAWENGWLFLLLFVPFLNLAAALVVPFKLARKFGRSPLFGLGLLLLAPLFYLVLGFGGSRYQDMRVRSTASF